MIFENLFMYYWMKSRDNHDDLKNLKIFSTTLLYSLYTTIFLQNVSFFPYKVKGCKSASSIYYNKLFIIPNAIRLFLFFY